MDYPFSTVLPLQPSLVSDSEPTSDEISRALADARGYTVTTPDQASEMGRAPGADARLELHDLSPDATVPVSVLAALYIRGYLADWHWEIIAQPRARRSPGTADRRASHQLIAHVQRARA